MKNILLDIYEKAPSMPTFPGREKFNCVIEA